MPAAETMNEPLNALMIVENYMEWTELKFRWFRPRQEVTRQMPIHEFYVDGAPLLSLIEPDEANDLIAGCPCLIGTIQKNPWTSCSNSSAAHCRPTGTGALGSCTASAETRAAWAYAPASFSPTRQSSGLTSLGITSSAIPSNRWRSTGRLSSIGPGMKGSCMT